MSTAVIGYVITSEEAAFDPAYAYWQHDFGWVEFLEDSTVYSQRERDLNPLPLGTNVQWEPVYVHGPDDGDGVLTSEPCDPRTCEDCRDANPLTGPPLIIG